MPTGAPLGEREIAAIEAACGGVPAADSAIAMIRVMRDVPFLGPPHVRRLRWADVEPQPLPGGAGIVRLAHWNREAFWISPAAAAALAPLRGLAAEPVFAGRGGAPLSPSGVTSRIRSICRRSGAAGRWANGRSAAGRFSGMSPLAGLQRDIGEARGDPQAGRYIAVSLTWGGWNFPAGREYLYHDDIRALYAAPDRRTKEHAP